MRRVTVLVCGDPMRGDDALAQALVDELPEATGHLAEIRHVGALMPDDLVGAGGPVIVVDAALGPPSGEIVDLPLAAIGSTAGPVEIGSSHTIPLPTVIALARAMTDGRLEGRFIGVAGSSWEMGAPISPAVERALPVAAAHLDHWIRVLSHAPAAEVSTCA
jgi:hydrogenase maturation protease